MVLAADEDTHTGTHRQCRVAWSQRCTHSRARLFWIELNQLRLQLATAKPRASLDPRTCEVWHLWLRLLMQMLAQTQTHAKRGRMVPALHTQQG